MIIKINKLVQRQMKAVSKINLDFKIQHLVKVLIISNSNLLMLESNKIINKNYNNKNNKYKI